MKKIEKQSIPNVMNLLWWLRQHKNVSVLLRPHQDFLDGEKLLLEHRIAEGTEN